MNIDDATGRISLDMETEGGMFYASVSVAGMPKLNMNKATRLFKLMKQNGTEDDWRRIGVLVNRLGDERVTSAYEKANGRKGEKMEKASFHVFDGENATPVEGYVFASRQGHELYVCKRGRDWLVYDPPTGLRVGSYHKTRANAVRELDEERRAGMTLGDMHHNAVTRASYKEQVEKFRAALVAAGIEPTQCKTAHDAPEKPKAAKPKKATRKARKHEEPKHEEPKTPTAELRFRPIESPWEGVSIYQKNPKACIWVEGKTGQCRDELMALGYRYSAKRKAWWLKPEVA